MTDGEQGPFAPGVPLPQALRTGSQPVPPAARHRRPVPTRRLLRRYLAGGVASALLSTFGLGACEYRSLAGNITSLPLYAGLGGDAGTEKPDRFGNTPIDVLVIGSDTRSSAADCALGKGCGAGGGKGTAGTAGTAANADVELLVHVAADRSNATVLSIPRDTVADLPACRDPVSGNSAGPRRAQINASLAFGPGCTVAAVHALTGIPVSHFAMLDFSAVVTMSNAVGGVPVCVTDDVYDTYSHLKLRRGQHVLQGTSALQFVRSRHGFGDGSDIGRTYAQHLFLGSMIRTVKSAGTLADPRRLLAVADAATKALTVDSGLGSIPDLLGLATDLGKVPPERITFVTMPTQPDPADPNRVVPAASASAVFAAVAADRPLPRRRSRAGTPTPTPAPTSLASLDGTQVRVQNATGRTGRAGEVARALQQAGLGAVTTTTGAIEQASAVRYPAGKEAGARTLAAQLGLPSSAVVAGPGTGPVTVVVGLDWPQGTRFPGAAAPPVDESTLQGGHAQTADEAKDCAEVSHARTVELDGVPLSPPEAYRRAARVPDSAP